MHNKKESSSQPNGFKVSYEVRETSDGRGKGLYATHAIPKGTLIWKYGPNNIRCFQGGQQVQSHLATISTDDDRRYWLSHIYCFNGSAIEILDDGKLWNHSHDPNTGSEPRLDGDSESTYATRDIAAGEELLDDYGTYEYPDWLLGLYEEYQIDTLSFVDIKSKQLT
jgi:SET domain-containing protein